MSTKRAPEKIKGYFRATFYYNSLPRPKGYVLKKQNREITTFFVYAHIPNMHTEVESICLFVPYYQSRWT